MAVTARLSFEGQCVNAQILLDTGATSNFMDKAFCEQHNIPLLLKKSPRRIETIDGRPLRSGLVTHETEMINVMIDSHSEETSFDVISLKHYPIILGMPWFKQHDPYITWSSEELSFPNCNCEVSLTERAGHILASSIISLPSPEFEDTLPKNIHELVPKEHHQHIPIFSAEEANTLPLHGPFDHSIPLMPNSTPPYGPIYSLSPVELEALSQYLKENLEKGFIRPSNSPAGAPILFVKKKDGSLRMCVDYRGLNNITVKNRYPLPLIHEMLDRLVGAHYFTKLDLRGAYNLVRIKEGEEWKTAFRTRYGHFEFMVMPFGLTNAPATFQALMNDTLRECLDIFAIVYLDDILIYSTTLEEHVKHVNQVLEKLEKRGLYVNSEKSSFHQSVIDFLGYRISSNGFSMDPSKITALLSWPVPSSVKEVQSFLGFANFYRRFVANYAKIAQPLTHLLRKNVAFHIDERVVTAFTTLKNLFSSAPILCHFDATLPIVLETDASDFAIGAVLSQTSEKGLLPVAYYSRKLSAAEQNYPIYDKEMLAVVASVLEWRNYLEGSQKEFLILTDHKNLEYFMTAKTLNRRQARWAELLSGYDYDAKYKPGKETSKANALSRRHDFKTFLEEDASYNNSYPPSTKASSTSSHPKCEHEANAEEEGRNSLKAPLSTVKEEIHQLLPKDPFFLKVKDTLPHFPGYTMHEGLLFYKNVLYVPDHQELRLRILQQFHDNKLVGHYGKRKTCNLVRRYYHWPAMKKFIENYVRTCDICHRNKTPRHKPFGFLRPLQIPERPWASLGMDFIVKLPVSQNHDSILCIVDRLTKMAHFIPCRETITSDGLAATFIGNIFKLHGLPNDIISDRGPVFVSNFWQSLLKQLNIKSHLSSAYHPQTDGQTERVNGILEQYLRMYCNYAQDDWAAYLPYAEFSYNNAVQDSIKKSPFEANYGFHPTFSPNYQHLSTFVGTHDFMQNLKEVQGILAASIKEAQKSQEIYYNKRKLEATFKPGDKVWLLRKYIKTARPSDKLDHKRLGPFDISEQINDVAFRLKLPLTMKVHDVFHVSLLEPYHADTNPLRIQPPPLPLIIDSFEEFEVSAILDSRIRRKKVEYLVDWKGYGPQDRTWQTLDTLDNALQLVRAFHQAYPDKPGRLAPRSRLEKGGTVKDQLVRSVRTPRTSDSNLIGPRARTLGHS